MKDKKVQLNEEEINIVKTYQLLVDRQNSVLGAMRRQYLASEQKVLEAISKAESDLFSHIKVLAQSKGISTDENWIFDPKIFSFVKRE
jgi:hypothetical protein